MLRALLGLLLFLYIVRALMRLLHGIAEGMSTRRQTQPPAVALQRDPVCGTYVVEGRALTAARNGQTAWFCSPECQHAWLQGKAS